LLLWKIMVQFTFFFVETVKCKALSNSKNAGFS